MRTRRVATFDSLLVIGLAGLLGRGQVISAKEIQVDGASKARNTAKKFTTISAALKTAKPGDTITVNGGIYREKIVIPSGAPGAPITLKAKSGQRVVISGFESIGGWKRFKGEIFSTLLNWAPNDLYVKYKKQPVAREPKEGWYFLENFEGNTVTDKEHVSKKPKDLVGATAQFLQNVGIFFFSAPVVSQDATAGTFAIDPGKKVLHVKPGDRYVLKNRLALIGRPGEWAVEPSNGKFKMYFWPERSADLASTQSPHLERQLVFITNAHNVRLQGIEVTGSANIGIEVTKSDGVAIKGCLVHNNAGDGLMERFTKKCSISRSLFLQNFNGVVIGSARDLTIEENEIAYNNADGIDLAGDTSGHYGKPEAKREDITENVIVQRNYVHNHLYWTHPDNIQLYRGVRNVRFLDNLLIGGGQGLMTEEVDGGVLTGNVILSSSSHLIIFGHNNSNDWVMRNNTFGLPAYNIFNFSGKNYEASKNVYIGTIRAGASYSGESNLFYHPKSPQVSPQEKTPIAANLEFINFPKAYAAVDYKKENTRDTLFLTGGTGDWQVGDHIEVNWDGVARQVTSVDNLKITLKPALPGPPFTICWVVTDWGDKTDFTIDTRPRPARNTASQSSGADSVSVGASLNVPAYRRGCFHGDGKRELPEIPSDVRAGLGNPNLYIPPNSN